MLFNYKPWVYFCQFFKSPVFICTVAATPIAKKRLATAGYLETQPQIGSLNQIQWFLKHYKYDWLMTASGIKKERRRIELVSHSDELSFALVNFWSHHMRASSHDESWKPSLCRPHWVESLFGIKFTYSKWCVLRPGYSLVRFAR